MTSLLVISPWWQ